MNWSRWATAVYNGEFRSIENVLIFDAAVPRIDGRSVKDGHRFELVLRLSVAMAVMIVTDGRKGRR